MYCSEMHISMSSPREPLTVTVFLLPVFAATSMTPNSAQHRSGCVWRWEPQSPLSWDSRSTKHFYAANSHRYLFLLQHEPAWRLLTPSSTNHCDLQGTSAFYISKTPTMEWGSLLLKGGQPPSHRSPRSYHPFLTFCSLLWQRGTFF